MRRRGKTIWATAGVGAAGAALAVSATMFGGSAVQADGSDTVVTAAMQRDLSLTATETGARLKRDTWAGETERTLRETLGTTFAGAWMSKDGSDLNVGVTTAAAADAVRAAGAVPKQVERGEAELTTVKKTLDSTRSVSTKVTGWYVDPASNSVVVVAQPGGQSAAQALAADSGVPAGAVRVVTAAGAPRLFFDVNGGDPYFIDNQFRCSIGFSVVGGFVSAGHCGTPGSTTTGFNQAAQGTFVASTFPGTGDFSFVEVNDNWTPQPVVATSDGPVNVAGSEEAPVGASICRTGSTTGTHCGVIQAKNATVNYPEGTVTGLTQTDVCAEGGDSGGPWLTGEQAQGVTSGGSGDCTTGGTTFFQPITEILEVNNLQLVTTAAAAPPATDPPATDPPATTPPATDPPATDPPATDPPATDPPATDPPATDPPATDPPATDPPATDPPATDPPAEEPPATDCPDPDATVQSSLRRTGSSKVAPSRGFRARAGQHEACLSGPDGTDFDLALQRWTGHRWRNVAVSVEDGSTEQLTFTGPAGRYRYAVSSFEGSGRFTLAVVAP